jgi:hypothetical protein
VDNTSIRVLVTDLATDGIKLNTTFPISSFSKIVVNGAGGDDRLAIDDGNARSAAPRPPWPRARPGH